MLLPYAGNSVLPIFGNKYAAVLSLRVIVFLDNNVYVHKQYAREMYIYAS